ncbi:11506_t:CDS:2 [Paraglomus brasilianum]|uniref:11506_t:CDS:1 n=1 Tax=Paraglomus brasilianum TaxID=144538 RepID=A0A9N9F4X8_9GLOM|nr:11506_t:CDS:2 [Paraglomus brasilianum]
MTSSTQPRKKRSKKTKTPEEQQPSKITKTPYEQQPNKKRKQPSKKRKTSCEQQPSLLETILIRRYDCSYEHVLVRGTVGGEKIDIAFQVPTISDIHQHLNNPRKNGQTCVHGAYLLFRTFFNARISEDPTIKRQRGVISKLSKEIWDNAGKEVKDRFSKLAKETHDKFKREVPLIWVGESKGKSETCAVESNSNNSEANVGSEVKTKARDVVASTTAATEITPTGSVSVFTFSENQPTNNNSVSYSYDTYEFLQAEIPNFCFTIDNTPDANIPYYTQSNEGIVDYSGPMPMEPLSATTEYDIVVDSDQGVEWREYAL